MCMDNPDILSTHKHTRTQKITTGLSQLLHNTDQQNFPLCEEKALIIRRESSALQARCGSLCFRGSSNLHLPTFCHLVTFPNKDPPCVSACSEVILLCDTPPPPSVIFSCDAISLTRVGAQHPPCIAQIHTHLAPTEVWDIIWDIFTCCTSLNSRAVVRSL